MTRRLLPSTTCLVAAAVLAWALVDEGRMAMSVRHPNVVQTLEIIEIGGEPMVAMEYVHGEALGRLIETAYADMKALVKAE